MSLLVTRQSFLNRYNKAKTRSNAVTAFSAFDKYLKFKNIQEQDLLTDLRNGANPYLVLDDIVQFWKDGRHATTVKNYFQFIKDWFRYNDINIEDYKIKHSVKFPKAIRDRVKGIDREIIKKLIDNCRKPIYKAYLLVMTATGMRRSECLELRPSWIDQNSNPKKVTIPGEFTKTGQERITFLTSEAWEAIIPFMPKDDSKIFPMTPHAVSQYIGILRKRCGFTEKGSNGFHHVRLHKIRGYTENKLSKSASSEVAHTVLGHTKDLIQYFQGGTTDEEFAQDYSKAIPDLTIEIDNKLKDENEKLKGQILKQDSFEEQLLAMQHKIKRLEQIKRE